MTLAIRSRSVRWLVLPLLLALLAGCSGDASRDGAAPGSAQSESGEAARDTKGAPGQGGTAIGQDPQKQETGQKAPTLAQGYQDPKTGLVVKTPYGWEAAPYEGAVVALLSPPAGAEDIFRENVLITYDDQFKNLNLAAYLKALAHDVRQRYPDTQTVESGEIEIAGIMGHWMIDTFTGAKGPSKVYRVVLIREGAAYVFHGTAPVATFDRYRPIFEAIARSITWPKPEGTK